MSVNGRYREFLEYIGQYEININDLAADMGIKKSNLHRFIKKAETEGIMFIRKKINRGLHTIQIRPACWERLQKILS